MGIFDRDYYRQNRPIWSLPAPYSAVTVLIVVNVAIAIADLLPFPQPGWLSDLLAVHAAGSDWGETLTHPWLWWQLITYGFAHSPQDFSHLLFNMLGLWFLGRAVEEHLGSKEFVRYYLVLLLVGALAWSIGNHFSAAALEVVDAAGHTVRLVPELIGASGAVAGVVVLFALTFPRRTILLFFVLPMPAWVLGVILVVGDMLGAAGWAGKSYVAYTVHLAGAAFALLYHFQQWNLGRLIPRGFPGAIFRRRGRLRVYDEEPEEDHQQRLAAEVDRILERISRHGEASLTRKERQTLEQASREYQRRRHE